MKASVVVVLIRQFGGLARVICLLSRSLCLRQDEENVKQIVIKTDADVSNKKDSVYSVFPWTPVI